MNFLLSLISLLLSIPDWAKSLLLSPKIDIGEITANGSHPDIKGGTILIRPIKWDSKPIIPAIYGSAIITNKDERFSETLKSCECEIILRKGSKTILKTFAPWAPKGQKSLKKEIDIKRGHKEKLHIFRAIIEPMQKENYSHYEEVEAPRLPILKIAKGEEPLYESDQGKVWIEMPGMIEAEYGGWHANRVKPSEHGDYDLTIKLSADNLRKPFEKQVPINFKTWLKENSGCWQNGWVKRCGKTIRKAKMIIRSI